MLCRLPNLAISPLHQIFSYSSNSTKSILESLTLKSKQLCHIRKTKKRLTKNRWTSYKPWPRGTSQPTYSFRMSFCSTKSKWKNWIRRSKNLRRVLKARLQSTNSRWKSYKLPALEMNLRPSHFRMSSKTTRNRLKSSHSSARIRRHP